MDFIGTKFFRNSKLERYFIPSRILFPPEDDISDNLKLVLKNIVARIRRLAPAMSHPRVSRAASSSAKVTTE